MKLISCKNNFDQTVKVPAEKFIFRPSVYGIILNKNKIVVLQNKSNNKLWFPGGGVEIGERLEEALKRETLEETGLDVEVKDFLFFYLCHPKGNILNFNPTDLTEESIDPKWIDISEIRQEDISDLKSDVYSLLQKLNKKI